MSSMALPTPWSPQMPGCLDILEVDTNVRNVRNAGAQPKDLITHAGTTGEQIDRQSNNPGHPPARIWPKTCCSFPTYVGILESVDGTQTEHCPRWQWCHGAPRAETKCRLMLPLLRLGGFQGFLASIWSLSFSLPPSVSGFLLVQKEYWVYYWLVIFFFLSWVLVCMIGLI